MKRVVDVIFSFFGLLLAAPILIPTLFLVWRQDWRNPLYVASRVGLNGKPFQMVKLRSMIVNADKSGVDSTSSNDMRITPIGHFIRRYKLDELSQLWNVLVGDMSMVGPRPNVKRETDLYTPMERNLLTVRPGITDFASIVFSDEGEILKSESDPDLAYNQLIRPGKSRLGLFYIQKRSLLIDLRIIYLTVFAIVSREIALKKLHVALVKLNADQDLLDISSRKRPLTPLPPPGTDRIVTSRDGNPYA